ncbi:MAG: hypothetical protein KIT79_14815 [Deltaproteobacteria bacterium]|nr:hypothetical protein [Deltaproteobacteria bacterium]
MKNRLLLTSVIRPFGGPGEGDSVGAELFHAQVTRAQGIFSLRQVIRCWAIDYLAGNIETPCTVLHYPSEREFVRELKSGRYSHVGINFVVATFHKARKMSELVRRHAPGARIIFGGYGTVLPDSLLSPFADHICREEGIGFLRKLLDEPLDRPVVHPYAPIPTVRMYSYQQPALVAHVTAGLGCPNGCDFCCTSHFFKRKYVPFARTGREIFDALVRMDDLAREHGDQISGYILIDEDFFLHKPRAQEFLSLVRQHGRSFPLMGFGSVKGLSQFSADEIAEMGFETIWTAFEGVNSGYGKLQGKSLDDLYASLNSRGINILASMIIGFPYQTREQILKEFDYLMKLKPSLYQVLIYFAFPGTPFHQQVMAEGRYLPNYQENPDLRRWDGFSMHFQHPNFTAAELEALQKDLFRQDFARLGPSIVRLLRVWHEGSRNLKDSPNPILKDRARKLTQSTRDALPALTPPMLFGPTRQSRREARQLFVDIVRFNGGLTWTEAVFSLLSPVLAVWTWIALRLGIFQQPALLRLEHRMDQPAEKAQPVTRIQGGFQASPASVLAEDIAGHVSRLFDTARLKPNNGWERQPSELTRPEPQAKDAA